MHGERCGLPVDVLQSRRAIRRPILEKNPAVATAAFVSPSRSRCLRRRRPSPAFCEPLPIDVPTSAAASPAFCDPRPIATPASAATPQGGSVEDAAAGSRGTSAAVSTDDPCVAGKAGTSHDDLASRGTGPVSTPRRDVGTVARTDPTGCRRGGARRRSRRIRKHGPGALPPGRQDHARFDGRHGRRWRHQDLAR